MRLRRFLLSGLAALVLTGCMQTGGANMFARNAPAPWQQSQVAMRPRPVVPAPVIAAPLEPQVAAPLAIGPQVIVAQPVAAEPVLTEPQNTAYTLDSGDKLRVVVFGQEG